MKKTISLDSRKAGALVLVLVLALAVEVANADFTFGEPVNLGPPVNGPDDLWGLCLSRDGLELYFSSNRPGGYGGYDLWVSKRESTRDEWDPPTNLGSPANSPYDECMPCPSTDGLTLYFSNGHLPYDNAKQLPGGLGGDGDIWKLTRQTRDEPWSAAVNIGPGINSEHAISPSISVDGLSLYFQSHRPGTKGGCDLMVTTRTSISDPFTNPVFLQTPNSSDADFCPDISLDGLVLFFVSTRPCVDGGTGPYRLWVTTRKSILDPFPSPQVLPAHVNGGGSTWFSGCYDPSLSNDGSTLYFISDRPGGFGGFDIYEVSIVPIVDFNGDDRINFKDFCELALYWFLDESSVDIGPLPLGDYRVDYKDLAVFTDYWLTGSPPGQASNPYPANYTEEVDINDDLSWTAGAGATSYDVYFGMSSPGTFQGNQTDTIFDPGTMVHGSTYYWRIDAVNAWGKTTGTVWSFTTVYSDFQAKNPNPSNGAIGVNTTADLSWTAGVGATSHDVYFGTSNPPPFLLNRATATFDPGTMAYSTKYYWRIDEVDAYGTTTGTVWSFTTMMSPPPPPLP